MSNQQGPAPGPEPVPKPGQVPRLPVSVPVAAKALGISERAVRKRIHAGTLTAEPFGRSFMVWLPDDAPSPGPGPGPASGPEPGPEPVPEPDDHQRALLTPALVEQAIARTGWQYTADLRALLAELRQVYEGELVAKDQAIAAKDETIAAKDQVIATQAEALAALREELKAERLRAARAESEAELTERFYDPGRWSEQRRQQYHQAREAAEEAEDRADGGGEPGDRPGGFLARLGRWWRGG